MVQINPKPARVSDASRAVSSTSELEVTAAIDRSQESDSRAMWTRITRQADGSVKVVLSKVLVMGTSGSFALAVGGVTHTTDDVGSRTAGALLRTLAKAIRK